MKLEYKMEYQMRLEEQGGTKKERHLCCIRHLDLIISYGELFSFNPNGDFIKVLYFFQLCENYIAFLFFTSE